MSLPRKIRQWLKPEPKPIIWREGGVSYRRGDRRAKIISKRPACFPAVTIAVLATRHASVVAVSAQMIGRRHGSR